MDEDVEELLYTCTRYLYYVHPRSSLVHRAMYKVHVLCNEYYCGTAAAVEVMYCTCTYKAQGSTKKCTMYIQVHVHSRATRTMFMYKVAL